MDEQKKKKQNNRLRSSSVQAVKNKTDKHKTKQGI
jgi:hypothetical protein